MCGVVVPVEVEGCGVWSCSLGLLGGWLCSSQVLFCVVDGPGVCPVVCPVVCLFMSCVVVTVYDPLPCLCGIFLRIT